MNQEEKVTEDERNRVGLCASCEHMRRVKSDRGTVFYRCGRAATDPAFKKYPPLPVIRCTGYEAKKSADI